MKSLEKKNRAVPEIGIGGVVFNNDNEVLMICRDKPPAKGQWSIPGGKLEPGESMVNACKREIKEETDIDVRVKGIVAVAERRIEGFHYIIIDFIAELENEINNRPQAQTDVSDARWIAMQSLPQFDLVEGLEVIIRRAYECRINNLVTGLIDIEGGGNDFIGI